MKGINDIIGKGYENMKLVSYKSGLKNDFNAVWYDELSQKEVNGVLKANYYEDGRLLQVYSKSDTHCVIVAGTGLGKTTQYVVPAVKSFARQKIKKSLVISDPKGEVRRLCANDLIDNGYRVLCIDFRDPLHSEHWNPLTSIFRKYQRAFHLKDEVEAVNVDGVIRNKYNGKIYESQSKLNYDLERYKLLMLEDVANDISDIATMLSPPTGAVDDKIWEDGALDIIKAFLWAMLEDSRPETKISRDLITEDSFSFPTLVNLTKLIDGSDNRSSAFDKGYFTGRSNDSRARFYATNTVIGPADKTRASFLSVFNTKINVFKDSSTALITCCNSFQYDELLDGPVAIFINYKDEVKTNYSLISLFVQNMYIYLIGQANARPDGKLAVPWYFILDEFGNFPKQRDFETVISACRGRNIFFNLIIQSYAQLRGVYGDSTSEIIKDNLNVHIFIGSNNVETLEAFSRECGKFTRISPVSALNGNDENMSNYAIETIPLLPVSTLAHFDEGECVVTEANTGYVLWSRLERCYKCPEFKSKPYDIEYASRNNQIDPFDPKYNFRFVLLR